MPLTPQQEREIYPLLDEIDDLEPKQGILYKCSVRRANYLTRMIQGVRYDSAIESIQMYQRGHPLYGQGLYGLLWVEVQPEGLLVTKLTEPHDSAKWRMIQCAAFKEAMALPLGTKFNHARVLLGRMQKKYPDIMGSLYVTRDEPITVHYGEPSVEELVVVDIDFSPDCMLADPTEEQIAKQEATTPYKKPR